VGRPRGGAAPSLSKNGGRVSSALVDHSSRWERLASRLPELGVDAFLVTKLPNVRYLCGFTGSNGQLLLTESGGVFLTDGRYVEQARHEVPDLGRASYAGEMPPKLAEACRELGVGRMAFEATHLTFDLYSRVTATGLELVPAADEVERLRRVKDPEERALLESAQAITDESFESITGKLVEGVTERSVALDLDTAMRPRGAAASAFEVVVAVGGHAAAHHHRPAERPLGRGDVVKIDFGCVVGGYHSDMTRTIAFGDPPAKLREVHSIVRRAQEAGVQAVRPGTPCQEVDRITREIIREAGYGEQYVHSVGHGVGLEIHEGPWLRPGNEEALPEGAVVTVEPGIYLEGLGGVRIEDMVEVRPSGPHVLPRTGKELIVL